MKTTITAIVIAIIIALCGIAAAEVEDRGEFYPRLAVVTSYERIGDADEWIIVCTDKDGDEWAFYGEEEDAHIGNIFNLLMWDLGESEEGDEVVDVYYEGRMDDRALLAWLSGD